MCEQNWSRGISCHQSETQWQHCCWLHLFLVYSVLKRSPESPYTCTYMPSPCASESIAVLHYVSWWCLRSSGVTLPLSINRWQHKIRHDERIFFSRTCFSWPGGFISLKFHIFIILKLIHKPLPIMYILKTAFVMKLKRHVSNSLFDLCSRIKDCDINLCYF